MVVEPVLRVAQPVCEADLLPDHLMSAHTAPDESRVSWPLSQGAFFRMQENVEGEEEVMEEEHEEHEQEQEEQEQEQEQDCSGALMPGCGRRWRYIEWVPFNKTTTPPTAHWVRPPKLKVRTPAHAKHLGWHLEFESRAMQDALLGAELYDHTAAVSAETSPLSALCPLCPLLSALRSLPSALCFLLSVLSVLCPLCPLLSALCPLSSLLSHSLSALCFLLSALCPLCSHTHSLLSAFCSLPFALCSPLSALCSLPSALCHLPSVLCHLLSHSFSALCFLLSALCSLLFALRSLLSALCHLPSALCPLCSHSPSLLSLLSALSALCSTFILSTAKPPRLVRQPVAPSPSALCPPTPTPLRKLVFGVSSVWLHDYLPHLLHSNHLH